MKYLNLIFCLLIISLLSLKSSAQEKNWQAKWIGTTYVVTDTSNIWTSFRKEIVVDKVPHKIIAKIATDSKYWLWINGKLVVFEGQLKRGPNPKDTYYDEVDISKYLKSGKNTIAILTWYWGRDGFNHKNSGKAALIFEANLGNHMLLSDKSWKVIRHPAFGNTGAPIPNYRLPEFNILFDARNDINAWQQPAFNDSKWTNALEYGKPPMAPWNNLVKRPIPLWKDSGLINYANQADLPKESNGKVIVAKLPKNLSITSYFKIIAPAGLKIDMRTDNYKGGGSYNIRTEYITKEGEQEFETFAYMNGHDVQYNIPEGVKILSLKYRETRYATEKVGSFVCDDPFYNTLWQKSYNTLNVNLRDAIQDPDRERAQWWGDAVILIGEIQYACDQNGQLVIQKAMRNLVDWQKSSGVLYSPIPAGNWDRELPSQMLASIGKYGFWTYYQYTGDIATIRYVYPAVKKYLSLYKLGDDGLVIHRPGNWDWLDWGKDIDVAIIDNSWYYMALDAAVKMANLTGHSADTVDYKLQMKSIKANFNKHLWNGVAYKSPKNKGVIDDRGNGLAVVAGLAEPEKYEAIKKVLMTEFHASPYLEKYIMESFFVMNDATKGLERMKKRYSSMVSSELSTLWEGWGIGPKGYGGGSYNHGWSGGPLTLLSQYVAGIAPIKPGYETFSIMPQLGNLKEVHCLVPSIKGNIILNLKLSENKMNMDVVIPNHTDGTIGIPKSDLNTSKIWVNNKLIINNNKVLSAIKGLKYIGDNGKYFLFKAKPGKWAFRLL